MCQQQQTVSQLDRLSDCNTICRLSRSTFQGPDWNTSSRVSNFTEALYILQGRKSSKQVVKLKNNSISVGRNAFLEQLGTDVSSYGCAVASGYNYLEGISTAGVAVTFSKSSMPCDSLMISLGTNKLVQLFRVRVKMTSQKLKKCHLFFRHHYFLTCNTLVSLL